MILLRSRRKIYISFHSIHHNVKQINIDDLKSYFSYKVEFDLILINDLKKISDVDTKSKN